MSNLLISDLEKDWAYSSDYIMLYDDVKNKCQSLDIILPYLKRHHKVIEFEAFGSKLLKFVDSREDFKIDDIDRGIGSLKVTNKKLDQQISRLIREQAEYVT